MDFNETNWGKKRNTVRKRNAENRTYDNGLGCWQRRKNNDIRKVTGVPKTTYFVREQIMQQFGRAARRPD